MKSVIVFCHIGDVAFIKKHFNGSVTHHDDIGKKTAEALKHSRIKRCHKLRDRMLKIRIKILALMQNNDKFYQCFAYSISCISTMNDKYLADKSVAWDGSKTQDLINRCKRDGIETIYYAGFHADCCLLTDTHFKMSLWKDAGFNVALLADLSDTLQHFHIEDDKHKVIYEDYLKNKFPFSYINTNELL